MLGGNEGKKSSFHCHLLQTDSWVRQNTGLTQKDILYILHYMDSFTTFLSNTNTRNVSFGLTTAPPGRYWKSVLALSTEGLSCMTFLVFSHFSLCTITRWILYFSLHVYDIHATLIWLRGGKFSFHLIFCTNIFSPCK